MKHMEHLNGIFYKTKLQLFKDKNDYKVVYSNCCYYCRNSNYYDTLLWCSLVPIDNYEDKIFSRVEALGCCKKFRRR